jgi:hypothetical protein
MHIVTINRETILPAKFDLHFAEMQEWAIDSCASYIGSDINPNTYWLIDFAFKQESDAMIFKLKYD